MKKNIAILVFFLLAYASPAFSNGITVQKVSLTDTNRVAKTVRVKFNISWENSWRDSINWDAAWIFIKYREPKDSVWRYRHMTLSPSGNDAGVGTASMKFAFPADNKGVFYYRQSIGSGKVKMDSVKLSWNYGLDQVTAIDSVEIKVFATEMVYVPNGSFCIGDGNGTNRSSNSFQLKNAPNNFVSITDKWSPLINTFNGNNGSMAADDAILYNTGIRISGLDGIDITGDKISEYPDYPTGFRSFYAMKYEVSQGQYADFLNTLTLRDSSYLYSYSDTTKYKKLNSKRRIALQNLDPIFNMTPIDLQRHTIILDSIDLKYIVTRPDRAFGKGYSSYASFSDWAALRPISELEYEKACKGPLPPTYKTYSNNYSVNNSDTTYAWSGFNWAWGDDTHLPIINNGYINGNLQYSSIENGTEFFNNYNIAKRYLIPNSSDLANMSGGTVGGDGGSGPFRVGIFATDTSSRISSGATYYGIMGMSKSVTQLVVGLNSANARSLSFKKHGDGVLNALGYSDANEFIIQPFNSMGIDLMGKQGNQPIAQRGYSMGSYTGFRSVRTAPSDN